MVKNGDGLVSDKCRRDLMNRPFRPTVAAMLMSSSKARMSLVVSAALCAVAGGPLGCGSTPKHAEMVSATANAPASPLVDRDKCNDKDKHVVTADINQDKKPDVWKFFKTVEIGGQKTEVMTCKQTDLNLDGKIDMVNYYDDTGSQIVLEEIDGDLDGKFDMTVYYNQGKRVRDEIDTNFDQRADVWKYYEDGKLVRIEFDKNNDGKVDEWDYYEAGKLDRIGYDTSGSGRVDRWDRAPEQEEEVPGGSATPAAPGGGAAPAPAGGATTPPPASTAPAGAAAPGAKPAAAGAAKPAAAPAAKPAAKK
jgi:hypothetical protein